MLLTTGERVAMALLAMALHDLGVEAISFTGSQSGILTDGTHSERTILEVGAHGDVARETAEHLVDAYGTRAAAVLARAAAEPELGARRSPPGARSSPRRSRWPWRTRARARWRTSSTAARWRA